VISSAILNFKLVSLKGEGKKLNEHVLEFNRTKKIVESKRFLEIES
jgi:hypothetical protein